MQQIDQLKFVSWFELSFEYPGTNVDEVTNIVGLTELGSVFHLIKFKERTIARKLNGLQSFTQIQVTNQGKVVAWNAKGESFIYSASLWTESPRTNIIKRWLQLWGITSAATISAKLVLIENLYFPAEILGFTFNLPLFEMFMTSTIGLSSGLAMLSRYDHLNTYPNGFVKTDQQISTLDTDGFLRQLQSEFSSLADFSAPFLEYLKPKLDAKFGEDIR